MRIFYTRSCNILFALPGSLLAPLEAVFLLTAGEEALTMYMDKSRLDRKSGNATQSVEALHQLASSYFVDRDGTMRRLHEIQISTGAIKVLCPATYSQTTNAGVWVRALAGSRNSERELLRQVMSGKRWEFSVMVT